MCAPADRVTRLVKRRVRSRKECGEEERERSGVEQEAAGTGDLVRYRAE